jgi:presenilin 1
MRQDSNKKSVLDGIGEEVTRVALPVSICMLITAFLVTTLNPAGDSNSNAVYIASIYYKENVRIFRDNIFI